MRYTFVSTLETPVVMMALQLALLLALALLARFGLRLAARQVEKRLGKTTRDAERFARLQTLVQIGRGATWALIVLAAGLMALHTLGIDITPLLAGVGVAGLALSLGAQTLIKDFIGGALILIENQFSVGDVIKAGEVAGGVERITLRATYLRDIEGKLHVVPNGDIRTVSNLTAEWARAIVDLHVDFEADMSRVMRALEAAAARRSASLHPAGRRDPHPARRYPAARRRRGDDVV